MSALAIIEAATAEGLVVDLSPTGSLKATGEQVVVERWRPLLKQHKAEIINLLSVKPGGVEQATRPSTCPAAPTPRKGTPPWPPLASWCKPDCDRLHLSDGVAWCCNEVDERHWSRRRISSMESCPAAKEAKP